MFLTSVFVDFEVAKKPYYTQTMRLVLKPFKTLENPFPIMFLLITLPHSLKTFIQIEFAYNIICLK